MKKKLNIIWIMIALVFVGSVVLFINIQDITELNIALLLGYPILWTTTNLRQLSLSSAFNNALAWIIFIFIGCIPVIIGWLLFKKDKNNKVILILTVFFSVMIYYLLYGLLNGWFVQPLMIESQSMLQEILAFIVSILLLFSLLAIWVAYIINHAKHRTFLLANFQFVLGAVAIVITVMLASSVVILQLSEPQHDFLSLLSFFMFFPQLLMIALIVKVIELLDKMNVELFSVSLLKPLHDIVRLSKAIVIISLILPIVHGLVQLSLAQQLLNIDVLLMVPLIELMVAFVIMVVSELLVKAIKTDQENRQFV